MTYYMIHCCNDRLWYVRNFLIPSMLKQGIKISQILVYQDRNGIGNLRAFIDSCNQALSYSKKHNISGIWHIQDDVVLSKSFKTRTERYDEGLVCGFTCNYDTKPEEGIFKISDQKMWFSFPCIRIPTELLNEFTEWSNLHLWQSQYFRGWVRRNKADDLIFREWLYGHPEKQDLLYLNLAPNLVNHIDDLIGGTIANKQREEGFNTRSIFWDEEDVIEDLKEELARSQIPT